MPGRSHHYPHGIEELVGASESGCWDVVDRAIHIDADGAVCGIRSNDDCRWINREDCGYIVCQDVDANRVRVVAESASTIGNTERYIGHIQRDRDRQMNERRSHQQC